MKSRVHFIVIMTRQVCSWAQNGSKWLLDFFVNFISYQLELELAQEMVRLNKQKKFLEDQSELQKTHKKRKLTVFVDFCKFNVFS